jgi:hypothetical protein
MKNALSFACKSATLAALGFALSSCPVLAECTNGAPPSYGDISSVMFERSGCGGFVHKTGDLKCSGYWVYFGEHFKTTYSQQTKEVGRGAFVLDATLQEARDVLARHDFFSLVPPDWLVTDISESIVSIRRCNIVTKLLMYPIVQSALDDGQVLPIGGDSEVAALFADFDALVARSRKEKVSEHFLEFNLNVFGPDGFGPPGQCKGTVPFGVVGMDCY